MHTILMRWPRCLCLMLLAAAWAGVPAWAESVFPRAAVEEGADAGRGEAAPAPHRPREEIEADIRALEERRADLLTRYAPAHPDVRAVERRLAILRAQLEMLNAPGGRR